LERELQGQMGSMGGVGVMVVVVIAGRIEKNAKVVNAVGCEQQLQR